MASRPSGATAPAGKLSIIAGSIPADSCSKVKTDPLGNSTPVTGPSELLLLIVVGWTGVSLCDSCIDACRYGDFLIDGLQPRGEYGAVHLRIEEHLKTARGFWERRISVRQALDRLKESPDISRCVEKQKPSLSPVVLFAAVAIHDVKDPDDMALLLPGKGPWLGSRLVFDSTKENAKLKYGTRASIVSALVDFEISRRATLFASGHFELLTFSRATGDTRLRVNAGDETNAGNSCRSLFLHYFSNRTLRELFKQPPNPQFWPKPVQWNQLPTDAAATMISARGIGSMILQEVFLADDFTNTVHEEI